MPDSMEVDQPMDDGEVTSVTETCDVRGNSAHGGLEPPEPMDTAATSGDSADGGGEDELSRAAGLRGCNVQDINGTNSTSSAPTSSGHVDADMGQDEAPSAFPAAARSFSPDALQERLVRMLAGGDGPVRSGWPACCSKVTTGLVLDAMTAVLSSLFLARKWKPPTGTKPDRTELEPEMEAGPYYELEQSERRLAALDFEDRENLGPAGPGLEAGYM